MNIFNDGFNGGPYTQQETEEHKTAHDIAREDTYALANSAILEAQQMVRSFWVCLVALLGILAVEYALYTMAFESVISASNEFFRRFTMIGLVALLAAHILVVAIGPRAERFINAIGIVSIFLFLLSIGTLVTKSLMGGGYLEAEEPAFTGDIDWSNGEFLIPEAGATTPAWLETMFRIALPVALTTGLLLSLYASVWLIRRIFVEVPKAKRIIKMGSHYIALTQSLRAVEANVRDIIQIKLGKESHLSELTENDLVADVIAARDRGLAADIKFVNDAMAQGPNRRHAKAGERDSRFVRESIANVLNTMNDEYVAAAIKAARLKLEAEGDKA